MHQYQNSSPEKPSKLPEHTQQRSEIFLFIIRISQTILNISRQHNIGARIVSQYLTRRVQIAQQLL